MNRPLYITSVREQAILTAEDRKRDWLDDTEAQKIFAYAKAKADGHSILPCYTVSGVPAHTIVDLAINLTAHLILGVPRRSMLRKARSRKLDPPGFQVPTRTFIALFDR